MSDEDDRGTSASSASWALPRHLGATTIGSLNAYDGTAHDWSPDHVAAIEAHARITEEAEDVLAARRFAPEIAPPDLWAEPS